MATSEVATKPSASQLSDAFSISNPSFNPVAGDCLQTFDATSSQAWPDVTRVARASVPKERSGRACVLVPCSPESLRLALAASAHPSGRRAVGHQHSASSRSSGSSCRAAMSLSWRRSVWPTRSLRSNLLKSPEQVVWVRWIPHGCVH